MKKISLASPTTFLDRGKQKKLNKAAVTFDYTPTPRQQKFHECQAEVTLFGGAAGGGKSLALLAEAFIQMVEHPGSHGIILRKSFPELESSHILNSMRLFPKQICRYNSLKHSWIIQSGGQESVLDFGHARTLEEAIERYRSAEYNFMAFDELTHWDKSVYLELISRVRSANGNPCRIVAATNPGNIGHYWVAEYFGIGKVMPEVTWTPTPTENDEMPMSRCFIPAKLTDNPHIDITGYMKRLSSLPPTQRRMLRDGDWTVTDGRFFPEFNESHIVEPFAIPKGWQCYRGVDYGFASPFACVWVAAAPDGHFYVYREIYKTNLRDIEQAAEIALMSKEPIEYTMCDPSMRSKNSSGTSPFESYFQNNIPMILADNDRVLGWMSLRNYLSPHQDGTPILKIFNTATNLIREFQTAIVSSKNPEDLDSRGSDHALDALRYWSRSRAFALPPAPPDPLAHLNPESKREWESIKKEREKQTNKLPLQNLSQLYPTETDYSEVVSFSEDSDIY